VAVRVTPKKARNLQTSCAAVLEAEIKSDIRFYGSKTGRALTLNPWGGLFACNRRFTNHTTVQAFLASRFALFSDHQPQKTKGPTSEQFLARKEAHRSKAQPISTRGNKTF